MNFKKEYFRIFLLLNTLSLIISLLSERYIYSDLDLTSASLLNKLLLLLFNIAIFTFSKSKNISEKINLIISLIIVVMGYFLISHDYYPFKLNNLTFGLNFLTTLIILLLNQKKDLISITKSLTIVYFFLIVISFIVSYQISKNQDFSINQDLKFEPVFSIRNLILPIVWLIILMTNKTILLNLVENNDK